MTERPNKKEGGAVTTVSAFPDSMLSIQRTKEILADANISDTEAEAIRDSFRDLAELIFDTWEKKKV